MRPQPTWAYAAIAVMLAANGVLLGVYESSYLFPLPFLLAAYLYLTPASLRGGRLVAISTLGITALSLALGLSYITTGIESGIALAMGLFVVSLDSGIIILLFHLFTQKKASGKEMA